MMTTAPRFEENEVWFMSFLLCVCLFVFSCVFWSFLEIKKARTMPQKSTIDRSNTLENTWKKHQEKKQKKTT